MSVGLGGGGRNGKDPSSCFSSEFHFYQIDSRGDLMVVTRQI